MYKFRIFESSVGRIALSLYKTFLMLYYVREKVQFLFFHLLRVTLNYGAHLLWNVFSWAGFGGRLLRLSDSNPFFFVNREKNCLFSSLGFHFHFLGLYWLYVGWINAINDWRWILVAMPWDFFMSEVVILLKQKKKHSLILLLIYKFRFFFLAIWVAFLMMFFALYPICVSHLVLLHTFVKNIFNLFLFSYQMVVILVIL